MRWLSGGIAVVVLLIAVLYFSKPGPPAAIVDRLCEFVRSQKMDCVAALASDNFVKPGAVVNYQPSSDGSDRIPLPVLDIFGSCLVPGADTSDLLRELSEPKPISIPTLTYQVDKNLQIGANLDVPQLDNANITAGPEWSSVGKIDLSVDSAWIINVDEFRTLNAIQSCKIIKQCVDHIVNQKYSVVGTTVVAKDLQYKIYSKSGELISLQGSAGGQVVNLKIGARSDMKSSTDATIHAAEPRVIGLRLMPSSLFQNLPVCRESVILAADGWATGSIGGGGGRGSIKSVSSVRQPISAPLQLSRTGSERSECSGGFERTKSGASVDAFVASPEPGQLEFRYSLTSQGGHYVTAATCAAGIVLGKTGHDTTATASVQINGAILATVRSEGTTILTVKYTDASDGAQIRVINWVNQPLPLSDDRAKNVGASIPISGSGALQFKAPGAGVYRIETLVADSVAGTGHAGRQQSSNKMTIGVSVN